MHHPPNVKQTEASSKVTWRDRLKKLCNRRVLVVVVKVGWLVWRCVDLFLRLFEDS